LLSQAKGLGGHGDRHHVKQNLSQIGRNKILSKVKQEAYFFENRVQSITEKRVEASRVLASRDMGQDLLVRLEVLDQPTTQDA
jgi:hypothetical protein